MKSRMMAGVCAIAIALVAGTVGAGEDSSTSTGGEVPRTKQTKLGLYVDAAQAYGMWQADPDAVRILDVRTLEEHIFVGHPEMAWNIPFAVQTHDWDAERGRFSMARNPDFVAEVESVAQPGDTILVMCRSGGRSAMAINALADAGFTQVYNIIDGMEGDKVDDPGDEAYGKRLKNGWKNAGLPWTYTLHRERILLPSRVHTPGGR